MISVVEALQPNPMPSEELQVPLDGPTADEIAVGRKLEADILARLGIPVENRMAEFLHAISKVELPDGSFCYPKKLVIFGEIIVENDGDEHGIPALNFELLFTEDIQGTPTETMLGRNLSDIQEGFIPSSPSGEYQISVGVYTCQAYRTEDFAKQLIEGERENGLPAYFYYAMGLINFGEYQFPIKTSGDVMQHAA